MIQCNDTIARGHKTRCEPSHTMPSRHERAKQSVAISSIRKGFGHGYTLRFVHGYTLRFVHGYTLRFVHGYTLRFVHGYTLRFVHGCTLRFVHGYTLRLGVRLGLRA